MANPFQEQLLKAGLVNKKQAKKAKREQHIDRTRKKEDSTAEIRNRAREEQEALARRNRELNRQRAEEARQREQMAQVRQLITDNRLELDERGEPYYFALENKIKRIFVSPDMIDQLSCGRLAIVRQGDTFEVVPAPVARQIGKRDRNVLVVLHEGSSSEAPSS